MNHVRDLGTCLFSAIELLGEVPLSKKLTSLAFVVLLPSAFRFLPRGGLKKS